MYEILSAPVSYVEIVVGYVGAAATKSVILGTIIFATANLFVEIECCTSVLDDLVPVADRRDFQPVRFVLGIWADNWEKLAIVPTLIITPLTFLGGSFYSISMLPPVWQTVTLFNPVVYLISGFRWSFYGNADVSVSLSLAMTCLFLFLCLAAVWWIFKTGYRLRS